MSTESAKDRMIEYARAVSAAKKDAWSEAYIFENYDDSIYLSAFRLDHTFLKDLIIKLISDLVYS